MEMRHFMRGSALVFAMSLLAACGGGGSNDSSLTAGDGGDTTGDTGGDSTSILTAGYAQGTSFTAEMISSSAASLQNGESATLTVNLANVDSTDGSYSFVSDSADVTFTSNCATSGQSTISPSSSSSTTGVFTATYTTDGCDGDDLITATISYSGQSVSASTTIETSNLSVSFGSFVDGVFTDGVINNTPNTTLSAGDTAQLSVRLVDQEGNAYTGASEVFFSSNCISGGQSEIDPAIVTNTNGTILATYASLNCDGTDTVTATTSAGGSTLTASVALETEEPPLGALQFISATPEILMLQGTESAIDTSEDGRDIGAQSTVTFKLTSDNGEPLRNQEVNFELVTADSGAGIDGTDATLSRYVDFTDADGLVSTVVTPGTTSTPIRVRATAVRDDIDISAVSTILVITTGIADQDSFSLSVSTFNIDGWAYDGIETQITIRAADRFNNPVPNGTAIVFWAEGAVIQPSCVTSSGVCVVTLTSQAPRPASGRVTILARAIGEESFVDALPTNGRFDDGEGFTDLPEPYLDKNENCAFDAGSDQFADFNNDGQRNVGNGLYDGLLCNKNGGNTQCNPNAETIFVSQNAVIVLSGSTDLDVRSYFSGEYSEPFIDYCAGDAVNQGKRLPAASQVDGISLSCGQSVTVAVQDERGQVPPAGTTMSASATLGTLVGPTEYIMPSTNNYGPWVKTFYLNPADEGGDGTLEITVTTPNTEGGGSTVYTSIMSVIQLAYDIAVTQPDVDGEDLEIDGTNGATFQLAIEEINDLGFPAGTTVSLNLTKGTIVGDTELTIPTGQLGTFRQAIEVAPSGDAGIGYLTVTLTTPADRGCEGSGTYTTDYEVKELPAAP
jgi:hypothetical protein